MLLSDSDSLNYFDCEPGTVWIFVPEGDAHVRFVGRLKDRPNRLQAKFSEVLYFTKSFSDLAVDDPNEASLKGGIVFNYIAVMSKIRGLIPCNNQRWIPFIEQKIWESKHRTNHH